MTSSSVKSLLINAWFLHSVLCLYTHDLVFIKVFEMDGEAPLYGGKSSL